MMKQTDFRIVFFFSLSFFCIVILCALFFATGKVVLAINGFAVDTNDRLYVGLSNQICVYENGDILRKFDSPTSDSYVFKITENNSMVLVSIPLVYTMDLDGNVLSVVDDYSLASSTKREIVHSNEHYTSSKGDSYQQRGSLGRLRIVKNNTETVYIESVLSVVVKYALILTFIGLGIFVIYFLTTRLRDKRSTGDGSKPLKK